LKMRQLWQRCCFFRAHILEKGEQMETEEIQILDKERTRRVY
jgi:hypothetical protein